MIKSFLVLCSFLALMLVSVTGHYLSDDRQSAKRSIASVSLVSKLSSLSWSVGYHESRIQGYKRDENPAYPQMQAINKMDFIYAQ